MYLFPRMVKRLSAHWAGLAGKYCGWRRHIIYDGSGVSSSGWRGVMSHEPALEQNCRRFSGPEWSHSQSPVTSSFSLAREFRYSPEFKSLGTRCQLVGFASIPISNLSVWSKKLRNVLQLHLIYNEHVPDEIDCLRVLIRDDLHPRLRISSVHVHWRFCRGNKRWQSPRQCQNVWKLIVDPNKVCKMTKLNNGSWLGFWNIMSSAMSSLSRITGDVTANNWQRWAAAAAATPSRGRGHYCHPAQLSRYIWSQHTGGAGHLVYSLTIMHRKKY